MAYTPTVWNTGDTITAEKLNKLENGVANIGGYDIVFTATDDGMTADGASFEELAYGGYKKALLSDDGNTFESIVYGNFEEGDVTTIGFSFMIGDHICDISLSDNGEWVSHGIIDTGGTYTYSNGHYVLTSTGSGGDEPGQ